MKQILNYKHYIVIGILVIASTFLIHAGIIGIGLLPAQASLQAKSIDQLMHVHVWIIAFLFSLIIVTLSYSLVVFRRKKGESGDGVYMTGSNSLEVVWTLIPLIVVIVLAYVGAGSLGVIRQIDPSAVVVKVIAQQWSWQFQYPDYGIVSTDLMLPVGKQIDLQLTSRDVIHGFWIPEFRVKEDLVPGQTNDLRITPTMLGNFTLRCSVLCGEKHAYMLGKVEVLSQADFDAWVTQQQSVVITDPVVRGQLLVSQNGCASCHSVDGTKGIGPTWARLYNATVTLSDGTQVVADDTYLTNAILDPNLQIVKGFSANRMPNFSDTLDSKAVADIIAYIKSLK